MAKFITIAGKKQVGKDTSAKAIHRLLCPGSMYFPFRLVKTVGSFAPDKVVITHFADALKQACHIIFGIPLEDMETDEGKNKLTDVEWPADISGDIAAYLPAVEFPLPAMFLSGADCIKYGFGYQGHMTVREVLQFVGTELFRNQLDPDIWVKSVYNRPHGEDDIVIVADARFPNEADMGRQRGLLVKIERNTGLPGDSHVSETALDDYKGFHHVIENNGSLDDLVAQWRVLLESEGFMQ